MKVIWTKHSETRQKEWERTLQISRLEIENLVSNPEQMVLGDMEVLVAQTKTRGGLLRVPFVESGGTRKILTVYWTSKVEKYWKEEGR
jgi:hypothetical protein